MIVGDTMGLGLFELFMGYKALDSLQKANESMTDFEKSKAKLKIDVKRFYTDNREFFGPDYVALIYEELDLIESMNIRNSSIIVGDVKDFLDQMEFHLIATSGFKEIMNFLKQYPKEKMKTGFLETCMEKNERIKDSYFPKETMEYWEDFISYLYDNNIHVENRDEIRKQLNNRLRNYY